MDDFPAKKVTWGGNGREGGSKGREGYGGRDTFRDNKVIEIL